MMVNKSLIAAAMLLGTATTALAEEHTVVMTGFSYFPAVTYAGPGDKIYFVNESGETQTVVGRDSGWTVGPLAANESGYLIVSEETELKFFAAYGACENGNAGEDGNCGFGNDDDGDGIIDEEEMEYGYDNAPIKAEITFDSPPLNG